MKVSIKGVCEGELIVRQEAGSSFFSVPAPSDGVIVQSEFSTGIYLRKRDLQSAMEACGCGTTTYEADVWSEDDKASTESVSSDSRRNSE